ncbi:MAG: hypothetical protein WCQ57_00845 [Verrucomicrobiota bacterium]
MMFPLHDGESVGTNAVADLNEAELIRMMVGSEVSRSTLRPNAHRGASFFRWKISVPARAGSAM